MTSKATNPAGRIGLTHVDTFSSVDGVPMYKDHQYEIVSVYNNTTKEAHDSMASVFLGFSDPELVPPTPVELAARASDAVKIEPTETAIVRTTSGDFALLLDPVNAPQTVRQFFRLASAGVYDHARLSLSGVTVLASPPAKQAAASIVVARPVEPRNPHTAGALSMCPGEATFAILIGPESRAGKCSAFGRLGPGAAAVAKIANQRASAEIRRIEFYPTTGDALKALAR
jgi:hypothetical protein